MIEFLLFCLVLIHAAVLVVMVVLVRGTIADQDEQKEILKQSVEQQREAFETQVAYMAQAAKDRKKVTEN